MASLPVKKIILGSLAVLVFLGALGTIGWVVQSKLNKERGYAASAPSMKELTQSSPGSKLSVPPATNEPASLESKADAKKALDAMDLSAQALDENIE